MTDKTTTIIKAGDAFILTQGEYSDFSYQVYRALVDFDIAELAESVVTSNPDERNWLLETNLDKEIITRVEEHEITTYDLNNLIRDARSKLGHA